MRPDAAEERERLMHEIGEALHALCQPLTALQCWLEIGQMNERAAARDGGIAVWEDCLRECERLNKTVATMRDLVQQARANEHRRDG